jgi:hypothetical protein
MIPENTKAKIMQYHNAYHETAVDLFNFWKAEIVFTFYWWIGLIIMVLPWLIWILIRDKQNTHKYLYSGFFVIIVSGYFDFLGIQAGLWVYLVHVVPTIPAFFIWDFSLLPVFAMLLLQFKPIMNPYIKALVYALITTFIGEPLFEWVGFYERIHWELIYSVPIQFIIFLIAFKLSSKIPIISK